MAATSFPSKRKRNMLAAIASNVPTVSGGEAVRGAGQAIKVGRGSIAVGSPATMNVENAPRTKRSKAEVSTPTQASAASAGPVSLAGTEFGRCALSARQAGKLSLFFASTGGVWSERESVLAVVLRESEALAQAVAAVRSDVGSAVADLDAALAEAVTVTAAGGSSSDFAATTEYRRIGGGEENDEAFERVLEATNEGLAAVMADYQAICTGLVGDAMESETVDRLVGCMFAILESLCQSAVGAEAIALGLQKDYLSLVNDLCAYLVTEREAELASVHLKALTAAVVWFRQDLAVGRPILRTVVDPEDATASTSLVVDTTPDMSGEITPLFTQLLSYLVMDKDHEAIADVLQGTPTKAPLTPSGGGGIRLG